ncbi:MAG: hypothetical protein ACLVBP_15835 [Ruminococcus sp.]
MLANIFKGKLTRRRTFYMEVDELQIRQKAVFLMLMARSVILRRGHRARAVEAITQLVKNGHRAMAVYMWKKAGAFVPDYLEQIPFRWE